jgi:hypothetical protein
MDLLRNLKRFLRSRHGVVLSLGTQLFRCFVIASVVCGGGGCMGVGCVDMQVGGGVIFALGH